MPIGQKRTEQKPTKSYRQKVTDQSTYEQNPTWKKPSGIKAHTWGKAYMEESSQKELYPLKSFL